MISKFIENCSLKRNPLSLLLLLHLLSPESSHAQTNNMRFSRITAEQGLSQGTVLCALQDRRGFMWFGTQDGLNRYDGYHFRVYKHKPDDANSLSENWVWMIFEDSLGYLWIGTFGGGACRFDPETETFVTYRHDPENPRSLSHDTVWSFYESSDGILWIGANDGLNRLDPKTGAFSYYQPSPTEPNVFRIEPGKPGFLWLLTPVGLHRFDVSSATFEHYRTDAADSSRLGNVMRNLARGHKGVFWLGTTDNGLNRFDTGTGRVVRYTHNSRAPASSPASNYISAVYEDAFGVVWAGTRNHGLSLLRFNGPDVQHALHLRHNPSDPSSLSHDYIFSIYESPSGQVWVGTRDGLNRFDRHNRKFTLYQASPNAPNSLSHKNVLPIFASRKKPGVLWVGTYDGLNRLDQKSGRITHYRSDTKNPAGSLTSSYCLSLYEDRAGDLWVGTRGGLTQIRFDGKGNETFTQYRHDPEDDSSLSNDTIHCIYEDRSGVLWIGTGGEGLCRYNSNGAFTRYQPDAARPESLQDPFVFALLEDRRGRFWVGTAADGLNLFDRMNGTVRHFRHDPSNPASLSNNRVLCLTETQSGDIWVGTAAGLNKLVVPTTPEEDFSFVQYHEADGLPNEVIYGILEDDAGHLWISTNRGLAKVRPGVEGLKVRTYTAADGLQSDEFNHNSFHKDGDGWMYFGGVNGLNAFHPDSVKDNPYVPPVVITDFKILNETVPIARPMPNHSSREGRSQGGVSPLRLTKSITHTKEVTLSYKHNVFSFEFVALNFTFPEKNQYAYMMEGFDEDWIYCGTRRFATYTNLDPGDYLFRVKGSNNDDVWNETGVSIKVKITPPPWQTWWAYGLYALAFLGSLAGFVRYKIRSAERELEAKAAIERAKIEERERVRRNSSADFHDEAGHMITKITLFLELAKRKAGGDSGLAEYLNKIEENTKALSSGMRDFIWGLDPEKDSLYDTLLRLKDFGNNLFQHSEIRFQASGIKPSFKQVDLPMHYRRSMIFIFKEAMNNCLKHSGADSACLKADFDRDELTIAFEDNGAGFEQTKNNEGYGLKNMAARAEKIGARLEISSIQGNGTRIYFKKSFDDKGVSTQSQND
ncbi:MAG: two-component regulator propeller domain-containing protein [bacterium]